MQPHETQIQPMEKEAAMTNEQILAEIREANLTYLMLAQNLIRQDKAEAVFRLGLNEEAADILASLSAAQVLKLASRNTLLCSFRVDDNLVWSLLTNHTAKKVGNEATNTLHASPGDAPRASASALQWPITPSSSVLRASPMRALSWRTAQAAMPWA